MGLTRSSIRVHDAQFCLAHAGAPKLPFHPKMFLFRSAEKDYALAGSGNLSRSGLSKGHEVGLSVGVSRHSVGEPTSLGAVQALRSWYSAIWDGATPLDATLLAEYTRLFESVDNLKSPTPTDDDTASGEVGGGALSSKALQKLRICKNFWICAGNITKNRGPGLPGSQLMMKRLSRVYFGFDASAVAPNTPIGNVKMRFMGGAMGEFSLTYSDNKMDKLNLPIPGSGGPLSYDGEVLHFRRVAPETYSLELGTGPDKTAWSKKSKAIGGMFKMSSGREWGVF